MLKWLKCLVYGHDAEISGGAAQWVDYECLRCGAEF